MNKDLGRDAPSVARGAMLLTAPLPLSFGLSLLTLAYLARVLGPETFGTVQIAVVIGSYVALLGDVGLSQVARRDASTRPPGRFGSPPLIVRTRLALTVLVSLGAATIVLALDLSDLATTATLVALLVPVVMSADLTWFFQARGWVGPLAVARIGVPATVLATTILLVRSDSDAPEAVIASVLGSLVGVAFLIAIWWTRRSSVAEPIERATATGAVRAGIALGAAWIAATVYINVDTLMLAAFRAESDVGKYGAAYRIVAGLLAVAAAYNAAATPRVNRLLGERSTFHELMSQSIEMAAVVVLPVLVTGILFADDIVVTLVGVEFLPADQYLAILLLSVAVVGIGSHTAWALIAARRDGQYLRAVAIGAFLNVALNFMLIPPYGPAGAAVATVVAEATVFAIMLRASRDVLPVRVFGTVLRPAIATIAMAGSFYVTSGLPSIATIPIGGLVYAAVITAMYGGRLPKFPMLMRQDL